MRNLREQHFLFRTWDIIPTESWECLNYKLVLLGQAASYFRRCRTWLASSTVTDCARRLTLRPSALALPPAPAQGWRTRTSAASARSGAAMADVYERTTLRLAGTPDEQFEGVPGGDGGHFVPIFPRVHSLFRRKLLVANFLRSF